MSLILFFSLGFILGALVAYFIISILPKKSISSQQPPNTPQNNKTSEIDSHALTSNHKLKQILKKEENKIKILAALNQTGRISNNEVESLLGVSDATATRYLEELEQSGQLKQIGNSGRGVYYQKINH